MSAVCRSQSAIAESFFEQCRAALRSVDPAGLYLGCRFAWANERAIRAAAKSCDVVSFNKYSDSVADFRYPAGVDKPMLIGEFHFGVARLGHDLAVAFDRQPLADEAAGLEQGEDGEFGLQRFALAIDGDLDHGVRDLRGGGDEQKSYHAGGLTFPGRGATFGR